MKAQILALLPIVLISVLSCSSETDTVMDMADLIVRGELTYKKFTNIPYTGKARGKCPFVDCRKNKAYGEFKKGKRHGDWVFYYDDGAIFEQGVWRNGEQEGDWYEYYPSGQLRFIWHHENQTITRYIGYFETGRLSDLVEEGKWTSYWRNGKLKSIGLSKDGEYSTVIWCNEDGTINKERITTTEPNDGFSCDQRADARQN